MPKNVYGSDVNDSLNKHNNIEDCIVEDIYEFESPKGSHVIFRRITFNEAVYFDNFKEENQSISFDSCVFKSTISFYNASLKDILFNKCTLENDARFEIGQVNNLILIETEVSKDLHLEQGYVNEILFDKCTGNGKISTHSLECNKVDLKLNEGALEFDFSSNYGRGIKKKDLFPPIKSLKIRISVKYNGTIEFSNYIIDYLAISGNVSKSILSLSQCLLTKTILYSFTNSSTVQFSSIDFNDNSTLEIQNSNLGKAELFDINFRHCSEISIFNINLTNLLTTSVKWCTKIKSSSDSKENEASTLREIYRQLKTLAEVQKDKPEELKFYAMEMEQYSKELEKSEGPFTDRIILYFNKWSNNHGLSFPLAFRWIIFIVLVFYFIIKGLLGYTNFDITYTAIAISEMVETVNPVRKFTESYGLTEQIEKNTGYYIAKILDAIQRIFISFLIFQFIKAFRKYVRN